MLCVLLSCATALGAPPTVDVPRELIPLGEYAQLQPKTDAKAITYVPLSGVEPFPSQFLNDKRAFILPTRGLAPGSYRFRGVASLNDEHTVFEFSVIVGGKKDAPQPQPPDNINPPTIEYTAPVWVFIVEESATRTANVSRFLNDTAFHKRLESAGFKWRVYDKDSADAKRIGLDKYPLPSVVFADSNGKVIKSHTMFDSIKHFEDALPAIKKLNTPTEEPKAYYYSPTFVPGCIQLPDGRFICPQK